jgi:hypothetical protein
MTRTDLLLTAFSLATSALFAWIMIHCGLEVRSTHPIVALKLYAAGGAVIVLGVWSSLWANARRRVERMESSQRRITRAIDKLNALDGIAAD